jgi:hypothetical protein
MVETSTVMQPTGQKLFITTMRGHNSSDAMCGMVMDGFMGKLRWLYMDCFLLNNLEETSFR